MGTVSRNLELNLKKLELNADRINTATERIQNSEDSKNLQDHNEYVKPEGL